MFGPYVGGHEGKPPAKTASFSSTLVASCAGRNKIWRKNLEFKNKAYYYCNEKCWIDEPFKVKVGAKMNDYIHLLKTKTHQVDGRLFFSKFQIFQSSTLGAPIVISCSYKKNIFSIYLVLKWLGKRSSHHSNPLFREAVFIRCKIYRPQEFFLREHSCLPMPRSCVFIRRPQDFCLWDRFFRLRSCQVMTGMAKWQNLLSWPINWHNAWWCVEFKMVTLRGDVSFYTSVPSLCLKMIMKNPNLPLPQSNFHQFERKVAQLSHYIQSTVYCHAHPQVWLGSKSP